MRWRSFFIVSDLHLGGEPACESSVGFQLCPPSSSARLARFIHQIARSEPGDGEHVPETVLVINGDFVDFLAEKPFSAFASPPSRAVEKLQRAIAHCDAQAPEGAQVFPALRELVRRGHRLVVLVGNHDVELSLPEVRRWLTEHLQAGRHVELVLDGEAYAYGSLVIEHGNRYDGWNAVAHGALRAYRSATSRREPADFAAPPGSQLVTEIMNPIKARYRFIDLLKPENEAVLPILMALEPQIVPDLRRLASLLRVKMAVETRVGQVPEEQAYIAAAGRDRATALTRPLEAVDALGGWASPEVVTLTTDLLSEGEAMLRALQAGSRPSADQAAIGDGLAAWLESSLSMWRIRREPGRDRLLHLRRALMAHRRSIASTFDPYTEEPRYAAAAERLSAGQGRTIVFGHTHFAKTIGLPDGGRYLNTGTWCPTIALPIEVYEPQADEQRALKLLAQLVDDLAEGRLDPWISLNTVYARADVDGQGSVRSGLFSVESDGRAVEVPGGP